MSAFQPRAILLTGAAGFIGSNLVRTLLRRAPDVRIVSLDKLTYAGTLANLDGVLDDPRHTFIEGDICDTALVERLLKEYEIDSIMHLAAESHVDRSIAGPAAFVQTNIVGTHSLLEAARTHVARGGRFRFLHVSTDEVYGTLGPNDPPFTERSPYAPNSPYSASKASADFLVRSYCETFKLPVLITNCSNNYGPHQHREKFLPRVITCCLEQQPIPVFGDGSNRRDWLYVEDHCEALWRALGVGALGETYCIGGGAEHANIDMALTICRLFDRRFPERAPHERLISFVTDRPGHDWRYAIDASKAQAAFDWRPNTALDEGLARTLDWYLAQPAAAERA